MDSFGKAVTICVCAVLLFLGLLIYAVHTGHVKELEFKYMAASAGAPLAVCVK